MADVIVIGGGAAGILAARRAADLNARVTLLEKNDRLGMKILISGGGKCNLTHDGSMEELRRRFRAPEALFLKPAFYRFTNMQFVDILHRRGLVSYTRPDGRVFPVEPANAKDVMAALTRLVIESGVQVHTQAPVTGLIVDSSPIPDSSPALARSRVTGVRLESGEIAAGRVIVCTGGSSYPATGTTGDGWRWLGALGHTIIPLSAALAPITLREARPDWSGIALRDILLRARCGGRDISRWDGDLLYTHRGVSGPAVLGISRSVAERMAASAADVLLEVDLVPTLSFEALQAAIRVAVRAHPRRTVSSLIPESLPARLADAFLASADVDGALRLSHLPAKSANRLVSTMKGWPLGTVRHVPLERGEVVAGGVSLDEVDPRTMQSRLVRGLYLCGEVLDIAGPVGGYNLQAAWSTGWVAGESAATAVA
ncbi:MAG: NAD(P)/FAD-dependent oxidoreductase [Capsulimonadaceae bacterium]